MFKAIQEIQAAFQAANLKCSVDQSEKRCVLKAGVSGKECSYQVLYISTDPESNDVAFRVFEFVKYPKDKTDKALVMLNSLQRKYRYFKFNIDDDNDVNIEYDFPSSCENLGKAAVEMLIRIMKIIDTVYPEIMRNIWA